MRSFRYLHIHDNDVRGYKEDETSHYGNTGYKKLLVFIFLVIKVLRYTKILHKHMGHMFK